MEVHWIKSRKEIDEERLTNAKKYGKVKIRKGKSSHVKAKRMAERDKKYDRESDIY